MSLLAPIHAPRTLTRTIMTRLEERERHEVALAHAAGFSGILVALATSAYSLYALVSAFMATELGAYAALVWSDPDVLPSISQELAFALAESTPFFALTLFVFGVYVLMVSVHASIRRTRLQIA